MKLLANCTVMKVLPYCTVMLMFISSSTLLPSPNQEQQHSIAVKFLRDYNDKFAPLIKDLEEIKWTKATNITEFNSERQNKATQVLTEKIAMLRQAASMVDLTNADPDTKRQFRLLLITKTSANKTVSQRKIEIGTEMENIYSTGSIPYDRNIVKSIQVEPQVTRLRLGKHLSSIMQKSGDAQELLYVWKAWRDNTGPKIRDLYTEYVRLNNLGAREHGFKDAGHYRRKMYEVDDLEDQAEQFLLDMRPFYLELHGYVRYRLSKVYPDLIMDEGLIPAHLLGNMWAQSWGNVYKYLVPFPDEPPLDVTPELEKLTIKKMFEMAEDFFTSIGWQKLPKKFWTHSLFEEPKDRKVECHASAWDFTDEDNGEPDVRVKMCTRKKPEYWDTIHHELGHSYYQLLYWNQPMEYRDGANPGFHEAVGDTMVLSVQTPAHLKKVGLLGNVSTSNESDINFLLKTALERIAFLPFGFLMDKWMWGVYSGRINETEYNAKWWEYRSKYQGIKAPIVRTEEDFDPGAKSHIPGDTPYIRYFFSYILQFTFHKRACELANNTGPLHQCSIYQSKEAGKGLGDMLALGKSKSWQEALKQYTGSEKISTEPIKEYFNPLISWLREYRKEKKYKLNWNNETRY